MKNTSLYLAILIAFFSGKAIAQCNNLSFAADSFGTCAYGNILASASVTDTSAISHIIWWPGAGLSDTNSLSPTITTDTVSRTYYLSVTSLSSRELIVNGDFSAGDTGFTTSYRFQPTTITPGQFGIGTNPYTYNPGFPVMGDHTTGTGDLMVCDGSITAGVNLWSETVTVTPNTYYFFSMWATLFHGPTPQLNFTINGSAIGSSFTMSTIATWNNFTYTWYSGSATSANIAVTDGNVLYFGNDFGMDDFSFKGYCSDTDSVYVNVINPRPVRLGNDTTICNGDVITLQSSVGYTTPTYLWNTGSTAAFINVSTPGLYWLKVTENGCSQQDTMVLRNKRVPGINLGVDTAFCTGSSYTINSTPHTGEAFVWSTGATSGSLTVSAPGSYWLTVDSNGCSRSDTIVVSEKPIPVVDLGPDVSECVGITVVLTSSVAYTAPTYLWSTASTASSILPTVSGNYWLDVTERGCTGHGAVNVTFKRYPTANLGMDTAFCKGSTYTLALPAGDDYYLWNTGAMTNSIVVSSTGTYWAVVDSIGCASTDSVVVTERPAFGVHLGADTTICYIASIILQSSDTYIATASYLWSTGATTPTLSTSATGTYWLQVDQLGCLERDSINIVIKYDSLELVTRDTAICKGEGLQVVTHNREIGGTFTYQWLPTAGIPVSTSPNPYMIPDTSATYIVTAYTPGCPSVSDSFKIDVQPNPSVYLGGNRFKCEFDTVHLNALVSPAGYAHYSYIWSPGNDLDDSTTQTVVFSGQATTKIYVTVSTPAHCKATDSAMMVVNPGNFGVITPSQQICPHDSAQVTVTGGVAYRWFPWLYTGDSLASSLWVHPVASVTYHVVVTDASGCHDTVTTAVIVNPAAVISLDDSIRLYPGESVHLSPLTNCSSFSWFPSGGLSSTTISDPLAEPGIDTRYFVTGTTTDGCTTIDSIDIIVSDESVLAMPNAFTPGSRINGELKIIRRGDASLNYYRVFNRWGNIVFETKNIDEGWDGTYKGTPQPLDVYVYDLQAITARGKLVNMHGNITLLR